MQLAHQLYKYTRISIFFAMLAVLTLGWIKGYAVGHTIDIVTPGERHEAEQKKDIKHPSEAELVIKEGDKIVKKHQDDAKKRAAEAERKRKEQEKHKKAAKQKKTKPKKKK